MILAHGPNPSVAGSQDEIKCPWQQKLYLSNIFYYHILLYYCSIALILIKNLIWFFFSSPGQEIASGMCIELHGKLKSFSKQIRKCTIGNICFRKNNDVLLLIDDYILEGKEVFLEKPVVVLRKMCNRNRKIAIENLSCISNMYFIRTVIIKKKIIFRTRPKPIITKVTKWK